MTDTPHFDSWLETQEPALEAKAVVAELRDALTIHLSPADIIALSEASDQFFCDRSSKQVVTTGDTARARRFALHFFLWYLAAMLGLIGLALWRLR